MKALFNRYRIIHTICYFLILGTLLPSCQKKEITPPKPDQSTPFSVYLSDAAARYQAVLLNIQQIWVNATDSINNGWLQVPLTRTGQFNLLHFQNGKDTLLASTNLPSGTITQLRLVLGDNNQIILNDGTVMPLTVTTDEPSTIKLAVHEKLTPQVPYNLVLDFNVGASIKQSQGGRYTFQPVIRTYEKGSGGAIEGIVLPDSVHTSVLAVTGTDTLSTVPDSSGYYNFRGLPEGIYSLYYIPDTISFQRDTLDSVSVTAGQIIQLDTVRLQPTPGFEAFGLPD